MQVGLPNDPSTETNASVLATMPAGQYLLAVKGVGNTSSPYSYYGSLGQYFISGTIPLPTSTDSTPPSPNPMTWVIATVITAAGKHQTNTRQPGAASGLNIIVTK